MSLVVFTQVTIFISLLKLLLCFQTSSYVLSVNQFNVLTLFETKVCLFKQYLKQRHRKVCKRNNRVGETICFTFIAKSDVNNEGKCVEVVSWRIELQHLTRNVRRWQPALSLLFAAAWRRL